MGSKREILFSAKSHSNALPRWGRGRRRRASNGSGVHGYFERHGFAREAAGCARSFPLTPTLSLGERVNHFAPLVCTSRAMDLQPSRQVLLPPHEPPAIGMSRSCQPERACCKGTVLAYILPKVSPYELSCSSPGCGAGHLLSGRVEATSRQR